MNATKRIVMGVFCLAAAGVFGETYPVTDVASLTEALGKAGDGDGRRAGEGDSDRRSGTLDVQQRGRSDLPDAGLD